MRKHYSTYQKRDEEKLEQLQAELSMHRIMCNQLRKRGMTDASKCENDICHKLMDDIEALKQKLSDDCRDISAALLKTFMSAYMAYTYAKDFEHIVKVRTGCNESDLSFDMKALMQLATEAGLAIDQCDLANDDHRHMNGFTHLTDKLEDFFENEVKAKVNEVMEEYKKTKEFKKLYQ